MSKKKETEIKFQLVNIDLSGMSLKLPDDAGNVGDYDFGINLETILDSEREFAIVKIAIEIRSQSTILAGMVANLWFHIVDFSKVIKKDKTGKLVVPYDLQLMINTVAIGTGRGILFSNLRGTVLHGAVLPIIDPKDLTLQPSE
jgi:hypothetical protein